MKRVGHAQLIDQNRRLVGDRLTEEFRVFIDHLQSLLGGEIGLHVNLGQPPRLQVFVADIFSSLSRKEISGQRSEV